MSALVGIRENALEPSEVERAVAADDAGAIVTFIGRVRNHNAGLAVTRLEYEAYPSMASKEMSTIVAELEARFPGTRLAVLHRIGTLNVGDAAVVCCASAAHRGEAFAACHALIDEIKARVPIWKREHGPDGPYWVGWEDARCVGHHAIGDEAVTQRNDWEEAQRTDPDAAAHAAISPGIAHVVEPQTSPHDSAVHASPHDATAPDAGARHKSSHDGAAQASPHDATAPETQVDRCRHGHGARHSHTLPAPVATLVGWRIAAITVSDTRSFETDGSGLLLEQLLSRAGANVERRLVRDDAPAIAGLVEALAADAREAIVLSGGTGIGPRDVTCEAIRPLLDRELEGFGEAFRRLSFDAIGTRALLSRAIAGVRGNCLVFALPGSPKAVTLALEQLILPLLPHARSMLLGGGH